MTFKLYFYVGISHQVENMVHSLLRVRDLSSRMMEMFDTSSAAKEESDQKKDESDSNQGGENVGEPRSVP